MATNKKVENSSPKIQEFQFHSVRNETKWESFIRSLYDPDKKEFFGRTTKSWYQLLIFYTIFYSCLAAFCAICMLGLIASLDDKEPKWKLSDSLIGTNPGLGFRPISENTSEGSLIWYDINNTETSQKWVNLVDKFLTPYYTEQVGENYQKCDYNNTAKEGHVCTVKSTDFGACTRENNYGYNYGYNSSSPCVFLKLNKIFGWVPDVYNETTEEMPSDLKTFIETAVKENRSEVWVSCEGENSFDKERVGGFKYFPSQGFPAYYFPYKNDVNYLSPLIAVQVLNVLPNAIVNIECRAWARNIIYNGNNNNRQGSIHFEILVDYKK